MTIFWCIVHTASAHISSVYLLMSSAQNPFHTTIMGKNGSKNGKLKAKYIPTLVISEIQILVKLYTIAISYMQEEVRVK